MVLTVVFGAGLKFAWAMIPWFWNVYTTWRNAPKVEVDDPWGFGGSLEWATSCPPPRHNFTSLPRIRSESPAFDLHHPEVVELELIQNPEEGKDSEFADAPDVEGRSEALSDSKGDDDR